MDSELITKAVLEITPDAPADQIAAVKNMVDRLGEVARDVKHQFEEQCIARIQASGDVPLGDGRRLYVGVEKVTKSIDNGKTLEALLNATGGDVQAIAQLLSSQPYKHGACRAILGDNWDEVFITEEKADLKTGAVKEKLLVFDPTFTKRPTPQLQEGTTP